MLKFIVYFTGSMILYSIAYSGPSEGRFPGAAASLILTFMAIAELLTFLDDKLNPPKK